MPTSALTAPEWSPMYGGPPPMYPPYPMPYYPMPQMMQRVPSYMADQMLPMVPFTMRPKALLSAMIFLALGGGLSLIFGIILLFDSYWLISLLLGLLFTAIGIMAIISIILLVIPKRIGWYIAMVTSCLGLLGLGPGTLVAIGAIISLLWPSTRFYFNTGMYPPPMMPMPFMQYPMMPPPPPHG